MDTQEAIDLCKQYGKEVLLLNNPDGELLTILTMMKGARARGELQDPYKAAFETAFTGFHKLFFG